MGGTFENWEAVIEPLAHSHTVIAPDLPGHGRSEPGGGDYSLGALATVLRDLLLALGHDRATLVGHSLGGGIAMQFAHQFPEIVERLVLVSSGGLGPEVSFVLRAAALPGADLFIAATAGPGSRVGSALSRGLAVVGLRPNADVAEVARGYASLSDPERRQAFLATLRSVVGTRGQRVDAEDRLYLAESLSVLIIWGERDPIIPASHGRRAHEAMLRKPPRCLRGRRAPAPARGTGSLHRRAGPVLGRDRVLHLRPRGVAGPASGRGGWGPALGMRLAFSARCAPSGSTSCVPVARRRRTPLPSAGDVTDPYRG